MGLLAVFINGFLSLICLVIIFVPLERVAPIKMWPWWRPNLGTDICFLSGNFLLLTPAVNLILIWTLSQVVSLIPLGGLHAWTAQWPLWLLLPTAILLSDMLTYWFHRLSHSWSFLWRFHRTHHSALEMDWIAAYREHPIDNLLTRLVENLPLFLLGIPIWIIAGLVVFRGLWALYIHSNIALEPGPLRYLFGSPRLHHWHHEIHQGGNSNFCNLNPLIDLCFGTYHDPKRYPDSYGCELSGNRSWLYYMAIPFRRLQATTTTDEITAHSKQD